jgi:hypothetical protein
MVETTDTYITNIDKLANNWKAGRGFHDLQPSA